ncbi:MAG: SRPBCC family protein [Myxococcales bacterium]
MGIFGLGLVAAGAGVAFMASRKPDNFSISRRALLKASPEALFPLVNDFHRWTTWSPWEKFDPNLQRTYAGPELGVGASYEWSGNNQAGSGKMTIQESTPNQRIIIELVFTKPMAATNRTEFLFTPKDGGTEVSWTMSGTNSFVKKLFLVFIDMEKFVGPQFEEGLKSLERVASGGGEKQLSSEV